MARCRNLVGARFNTPTLRMELTSFYELMFNAVAQAKFVHGATSFSLASALSVVVLGAEAKVRVAVPPLLSGSSTTVTLCALVPLSRTLSSCKRDATPAPLTWIAVGRPPTVSVDLGQCENEPTAFIMQ